MGLNKEEIEKNAQLGIQKLKEAAASVQPKLYFALNEDGQAIGGKHFTDEGRLNSYLICKIVDYAVTESDCDAGMAMSYSRSYEVQGCRVKDFDASAFLEAEAKVIVQARSKDADDCESDVAFDYSRSRGV